MTEDEAQEWIIARHGVECHARLARLVALVVAEASQQNLVAPSTIDKMWARHIVDSAQLLYLTPTADAGLWIDIGSGAGFPGLVIAALGERPMLLVEPRRRRATFLTEAVETLGLTNHVDVIQASVERLDRAAAVISARAVAPLTTLFELAAKCRHQRTSWVLPRGRSAAEEVANLRTAWHGTFHVEHSVTDPQSRIVVASGVSRR